MSTDVAVPSYADDVVSDGRVTAWQASGLIVRGREPLTLDEIYERVPAIGSRVVSSDVSASSIDGTAGFVPAPGWKANVREDDNSVLGIVRGRYKIVQNRDAFAFGADILSQSGAFIDSAGVINNGGVVWVTMNMDHDVMVAGKSSERLGTYLLMSNGHDGKHGITAAVVTLRMACNNQFAVTLRDAVRKFTIRHTGDTDGRLMEARKALEISFKYTDEIAKIGETLINQSYPQDYLEQFLTKVVPMPEDPSDRQITIVENKRAAIASTLKTAPDLNDIRDTKWGLIQAVSDWENHQSRIRVTGNNDASASRMARLVTGNQTASQRALAVLTAA